MREDSGAVVPGVQAGGSELTGLDLQAVYEGWARPLNQAQSCSIILTEFCAVRTVKDMQEYADHHYGHRYAVKPR